MINKDDYEFIEACLDIERDKLDAVLSFIVEQGSEEQLMSYLDDWIAIDHDKIDYESLDDVVQLIENIKLKDIRVCMVRRF